MFNTYLLEYLLSDILKYLFIYCNESYFVQYYLFINICVVTIARRTYNQLIKLTMYIRFAFPV